MNIFKKIKAWNEIRKLNKEIGLGLQEYASFKIENAKRAAQNHTDKEYGDYLLRKLIEYDFKRQADARSVGLGCKRGSNYN